MRTFIPVKFISFLLLLVMMLLKPNGLFGNYEIPYLRQFIPALRSKTARSGEEAKP